MPIQSPLYSLTVVDHRDIIKITGTDLIIAVYALEDEPFDAAAHKMVFYGDDHGALLAFVVNGWNDDTIDEHLELASVAIMWYAKYLDYPQMELQLQDPRPVAGTFN